MAIRLHASSYYADSEFFHPKNEGEGVANPVDPLRAEGGVAFEYGNFFSLQQLGQDTFRRALLGVIEEGERANAQIEHISRIFEEAKVFHEFVLRLKLPDELAKFVIRSEDDLVMLLSQLSSVDHEMAKNASIICALLKISLAIDRAKKQEFNHFDLALQYLLAKLVEGLEADAYSGDHHRMDLNGEEIRFQLKSRAKKFERILIKLLKSPDCQVDVVEDGLGVRVLVESVEDLIGITTHLVERVLEEEMDTEDIRMLNFNFLTENEVEELSGVTPGRQFESYINPDAADNFHAFFLLAKLRIGSNRHAVPFEIQFNKSSADLDAGMAHHAVYELKQLLGAITNIYGYISEEHLNDLIVGVEKASGRNFDEIKSHVIGTTLLELASDKNGGKRFASRAQVEELKAKKLFPEKLLAGETIPL